MKNYYLGIDIGASSGRHILASKHNNKIELEEIYRFSNGAVEIDGTLCWDIDTLFEEVKNGIKKCVEINKIPTSIGIDTWGVDFVLIDDKGNRIGKSVCYRDSRTIDMDKEVYKVISESDLYERIGIQKQIFNTIYQCKAIQMKTNDLEKADALLMIPDYLNYLLTGKKVQEYTNASTTGLLNPNTHEWDFELIHKLGYPRKIFKELVKPGTVLGNFSEEIKNEIGFDCKVICVTSHDTASAILAIPNVQEDVLYISSGTWSLMGTLLDHANTSEISQKYNFTNEGGYEYKVRYLKNIMGLWMIQSVKKQFEAINEKWTYDELCKQAEMETIDSIVDCNSSRFLAPKDMILEIQNACKESNQEVPMRASQLARVIYRSLAYCYKRTKDEIESITNKTYDVIHIVGGGANAAYLNNLTATICNCKVCAGPIEATAIGNAVSQMIEDHVWDTSIEAKKCIYESFECKMYGGNEND